VTGEVGFPFPQYFFFCPALWLASGRCSDAVYSSGAGISNAPWSKVPGRSRYQARMIMIPSCREVICSRSRTVSLLPVAQRREASAQASGLSDVAKETLIKGVAKPFESKTRIWQLSDCQKQPTKSLTLLFMVGARNPRANTVGDKVPT
jgi:hypothetical protein